MHPVPGYPARTPFWRAGPYWSLNRDQNGNGRHTGLDFPAPQGTPIRAMTHGRVLAAGVYDRAYGYKVIIRLGRYDYWYCHMPKDAATVRVGQLVEAGELIGRVGSTGNVTGAHLHVEKRTKGGRFAVGTFRDPMTAVRWQPPAIRYETINVGDDNPTGKATRAQRRGRLLTDILRPGADYILFQEAPGHAGGLYRWLQRQVDRRSRGRRQRHRQIVGGRGRRIWGGRRVAHIAGGVHVPTRKGDGGRDQPVTWTYDRVDRFRRRLVVNVHGPFGISRKKKQAYWTEVLAWIDRKRRNLDLEWWQVTIAGDFNARRAPLRAARKYGLRDAMSLAKKRRRRLYSSTNSWRYRNRLGRRIDLFLVAKTRPDSIREVRNTRTRWNNRGTRTVTDHNRQVLIIK